MALSKRLLALVNQIEDGSSVFDVGADHGLLEKYLLDNKKVAKICAVENKVGPFNILSTNLKDYKITLSLSDGLDELNNDYDTLIIAGMGGKLICDILSKHLDKLKFIKNILIDAHRDIYDVKSLLINNGFYINFEDIIKEKGKYYFIIKFKKGKEKYSDFQLKYGAKVLNKDIFSEYIEYTKKQLNDNLIKIKESSNDNKKIKMLTQELERLNDYENN